MQNKRNTRPGGGDGPGGGRARRGGWPGGPSRAFSQFSEKASEFWYLCGAHKSSAEKNFINGQYANWGPLGHDSYSARARAHRPPRHRRPTTHTHHHGRDTPGPRIAGHENPVLPRVLRLILQTPEGPGPREGPAYVLVRLWYENGAWDSINARWARAKQAWGPAKWLLKVCGFAVAELAGG